MRSELSLETPEFDKINPISCVNAKLRKLHRLVDSVYRIKLKPFGLKGSMVSMMFIIGKREGVNQKVLSDMLILDQSTVSRDIKKLLSKGVIQIDKSSDSRNSSVRLTSKGAELLERVSPVWAEIHSKVEALLGSFNIQQIDSITQAVQTNLTELKK